MKISAYLRIPPAMRCTSPCLLCAKSGHSRLRFMWRFRSSQLSQARGFRSGPGQWLAEAIATFGLLLEIFGCLARVPTAVPYAVGLYITSAYWFTASTSFANPAVTVARSLTDTFAGIAPTGVPMFAAAQFAGMLAALLITQWLWRPKLQLGCRKRPSKNS